MSCLESLFPSALVFQCRMAMEKLKSCNALSNFATTSTASSRSTVLQIESDRARIKNTPQGLKPIAFCGAFGTDQSVPLQGSAEGKQRAETLRLKPSVYAVFWAVGDQSPSYQPRPFKT